jgi:hypothetical protein
MTDHPAIGTAWQLEKARFFKPFHFVVPLFVFFLQLRHSTRSPPPQARQAIRCLSKTPVLRKNRASDARPTTLPNALGRLILMNKDT